MAAATAPDAAPCAGLEAALARPGTWRAAAAALLAAALVVGASGMRWLPIDAHEGYVVRTVQEMHERGGWVVPWYNGEPRLTKPPLSYWLTGLAAWAADGLGQVRPWHGRLPSLLAGLGLVLLTLALGRRLFDRGTALLGAALLASSAGYFAYTHDARPDLVYAFFATAGLAAFARARAAADGSRAQLHAAWGMWLAWALATLAKGPHLPAMLLLALIIACLLERMAPGRILRSLRPLSGVALLAAVAAPWWWLVSQRLGPHGLEGTQLEGALLTVQWRHVLDPYYLYRPLQLILPWIALVPGAILLAARRRGAEPGARLLGLSVLVPALLLGLGPQHRWFYMLPVLVPMCLLLAAGVTRAGPGARRLLRWLLPSHWLILVVLLAAAAGWTPRGSGAALPWLAAAAALASAVALAGWRLRARGAPATQVLWTAGMFAAALALAAQTGLPWSADRFDRARLAQTARAAAAGGAPVVSLRISPNVYNYYVREPVPELDSLREVGAALARAPHGRAVLIVRSARLPELPSAWRPAVLDRMPGDEDEATSVVVIRRQAPRRRIRRRPGAGPPAPPRGARDGAPRSSGEKKAGPGVPGRPLLAAPRPSLSRRPCRRSPWRARCRSSRIRTPS